MTSAAQLEANRRNAQHSTGPRTSAGKSRSSENAVKHGFTARLLVGLQHGPFADNPDELRDFIQAVLAELAPVTAQERADGGRHSKTSCPPGGEPPAPARRRPRWPPPRATGHVRPCSSSTV